MGRLRALWSRIPESWRGVLAVSGSFGALGFLPLLGPPGYESGLILGLFGAPIAGCWAVRRSRGRSTLLSATTAGGLAGLLVLLGFLVSATLHGLVSGFCDGAPGLAFLLLGAGFGVFFSGVVSSLFAYRGKGSSLFRTLLFGVGPTLFFAILFAVEFYATPAVYGFSPFVGYFGGPLYDTVHFPFERLLSYRVAHVLLLASVVLVGVGERAKPAVQRKLCFLLGLFAFLGAVTLSAEGEALGHRTTRAGLRAALGGFVSEGSCDIVYSARTVPVARARLLGRECRAHVTELREFFGVPGSTRRYTVFLFGDRQEKGRFVGASTTYVAKPWRREVYVNVDAFPHPVLRHELAHAVSAELGVGPFRLAGSFFGLLPDPGRIEGVAVAAAPRDETTGDLFEWARAQKDLGRLPRPRDLFGLRFYAEAAARAYVTAGAFVLHVREAYGPELLRRWYGGEELPRLTKRSWDELEKEFFSRLMREVPSERLLREAARKFSAPSVFERRCPQRVGRLLEELAAVCGGDSPASEDVEAAILRFDPGQHGLLVTKAECLSGAGELKASDAYVARARKEFTQFFPWEQARVHALEGDISYRAGKLEEAQRSYETALQLASADGERRTLELKLWGLSASLEIREHLFGALVPEPERRTNPLITLSEWAAEGSKASGVPEYLLGRYLLQHDAASASLRYLTKAMASELPLGSLREEAARSGTIAACEVRDEASLRSMTEAWQKLAVSAGQKRAIANLAHWCMR